MKLVDEEIDKVIDGLRVGLGSDECVWSAIEAATRVLEAIKELSSNLEGIRDYEFDRIILDAIGD